MVNKIVKVEEIEFEDWGSSDKSEIQEEIMEDREIEAITNKRFKDTKRRLEIAKECFI